MKLMIMSGFLLGIGITLALFISINAIQNGGSETSTVNGPRAFQREREGDYNVYALKIPQKLSFAGEEVPLHMQDVRERMDRELLVNTYWQSNGLLLIKRAHRYFPVIEPILEANELPEDFKYLAVTESGLMNVTSPAGAKGIWQIMGDTGKEYGLEINKNVDERYHLEKATKVACDYLKEAKEKFGNWTLAAASYNMGMNGVQEQIDKQRMYSYYDLLLGEEPERYIFRLLAIREIIENPSKYGFNITDDDLYKHIPVRELKIDTSITDIARFAKDQGINYKILKLYNPWLRENTLNNSSRKKYIIKIPKREYYDK